MWKCVHLRLHGTLKVWNAEPLMLLPGLGVTGWIKNKVTLGGPLRFRRVKEHNAFDRTVKGKSVKVWEQTRRPKMVRVNSGEERIKIRKKRERERERLP